MTATAQQGAGWRRGLPPGQGWHGRWVDRRSRRHGTVNPRLIDGDGRTATGGQGDNSTLRPRRQDDDCAIPTSGSLDTSARTGSRPILTGTAASRIPIPRISTARIPRSTTVSQAIGPMGLPRRACRQSWQRCRTRRPPHHQRHLCICPVPKTHRAVHRTVITVATRARPFTAHPSVGQSHAVIRPGSAYATNPVNVRGHRTNPGLGFGTSLAAPWGTTRGQPRRVRPGSRASKEPSLTARSRR